jgi:IrrE N-terminal-like domain
LGIVVAESIYEGASNGCLFSSEIILHEVGHLFLHHKYEKVGLHSIKGIYKEQIVNTNPSNSVEWQANTFAICALFPFNVTKNFNSSTEIKAKFGLSEKNSLRIFSHVHKLRMRETYRNLYKDHLWLQSVISDLKSFGRNEVEKNDCEIQLSLFGPPRTSSYGITELMSEI